MPRRDNALSSLLPRSRFYKLIVIAYTYPMPEKTTIDELAGMVQRGFAAVDKRFDAIDTRLDRIENFLLADHKRRIERLEQEVKDLKNALAM
jgi:hypothetical protein